MAESVLAQAIRNVAEGETRVAQQQLLIRELEKEGSEIGVSDARSLLAVMEENLALMRDRVRMERAKGMN